MDSITRMLDKIRQLILKNRLKQAIEMMEEIIPKGYYSNLLIQQSAQYYIAQNHFFSGMTAVEEKVRAEARIIGALLHLLDEFQNDPSTDLSQQIKKGDQLPKNTLPSSDGNTVNSKGNGNNIIQGPVYGNVINKTVIKHVPALPKTAEEFFIDGSKSFNKEIARKKKDKTPNFTDALNCFNAAITYKPDYVEAILARGYIFYNMGDYDAAKKNFKEVLNLQDNNCDAYYFLALSFINLEDPDRAYNWLERSCEFDCPKREKKIDELFEMLKANRIEP